MVAQKRGEGWGLTASPPPPAGLVDLVNNLLLWHILLIIYSEVTAPRTRI